MPVTRPLLVATLICALSLSHSNATAQAQASKSSLSLNALADRYYEEKVRLDPVYTGTLSGDNRFDDQLPITIAPAMRKKCFVLLHQVQRQLGAIGRHRLNETDAITYDVLSQELRTAIGFEKFSDHLLPMQQMNAIPTLLANFGSGQAEQPLKTVAHYDSYLKRIARLPEWTNQAIANMREGMKRRIVQPRPIVEETLEQVRSLASGSIADSPFYAPIRSFPASFDSADRSRLTTAYRDTVEKEVLPAMRALADFLEKEYLSASRASAGWGSLPHGQAWYRQWVRYQTTTDLSPEQIHTMGLKEVARIEGEFARVAQRMGYQGELRRFPAWINTNPSFRVFHSENEILEGYRAINEKVKARMPELFGRVPKAALDIQPEPALTKATASDHYSVPAPDGSRPGVFWVVIIAPDTYNMTRMGSLFLHEGQPGHHLQQGLQLEQQLPKFRRYGSSNAFLEGWALYAETLGHEIGLYDDPAVYAGELRMEMARAVRLVVDTGMHAFGWSREQAIDYWMDKVGSTQPQARNQIDRYLAWPAQALSYKLGALKILELRERARRQLGGKFKLAAFHDEVLAEGALPLPVLEARINHWIASQR